MIVYGSKQCPDTMACLAELSTAGTPYEFRNMQICRRFIAAAIHSLVRSAIRRSNLTKS